MPSEEDLKRAQESDEKTNTSSPKPKFKEDFEDYGEEEEETEEETPQKVDMDQSGERDSKEQESKRRTYKLLPKHIKMLKFMKIIDDDKTYTDFVRECIEIGWKHKYRDKYEEMNRL